ncbi:ATP-binding protein [Actinoplanes philippinensis]|uniref:ATP-binding protein n=1 Tax=Actinoplanes philippinensis TaxID=35752 RepID=UPI0033E462D3
MASLGEKLHRLRQRSFAGREDEIALFRAVLATSGVLFVHGPGGIGKSTLLDAFAQVAAEAGRTPTRVDARHLSLGPDPLPTLAGEARPVLLIDTYERLESIDDQVRERYLPSLPGDSVVVIAGRHAPGPRWRADPAWRELMHVVPLGNLPDAAGRAHLAAQGIPESSRGQLLAISRGHPLTLSMLVDAVQRGASPRALSDVPDVVGALLTQIVEEAPTVRHRAALEVCAHVPVTTEDLLATLLGTDAGDLFAWLRTLPFVVESPHGLYPHDVVRDAIDTDLRWRAPDRYADLYRRKLAAFLDQIRAVPGERERIQLLVATILTNRTRSGIPALRALPPAAPAYIDRLHDGDRRAIVAMTAARQDERQARLVEHWMRRQPGAFRVFRISGELCGYTACLDLTAADGGVDPVVDGMWGYVSAYGPPRPGERVRAWRFFVDREHGQRPSPSMTLFLAAQMLDIIELGDDVAWTLVGALDDAGWWRQAMEFLDFGPAHGTPGIFAHDWRRTDRAEWVERLHARQIGAPVRPPGPDLDRPVLSRPEFAEAVRSALRCLHEPAALGDNPLLRARMVRHGRSPAEQLRDLIDAATRTLPADLNALVTRTFLEPAATQERVAASLHLSFNTYRRHRDRAVAHITDWLWSHETGAATPAGTIGSASAS